MIDHPDANARIGQNLRRLRLNRRFGQARLATALGTHRTVVARIEAGTRPLRLSEAVVLEERLGIQVEQLADAVPVGF